MAKSPAPRGKRSRARSPGAAASPEPATPGGASDDFGAPDTNPFTPAPPLRRANLLRGAAEVAAPPTSLRTGRKIVVLAREGVDEGEAAMTETSGFEIIDSSEADAAMLGGTLGEKQAVAFRSLGVAVTGAGDPGRAARLEQRAGMDRPVRFLEDERYVFHAAMDAAWLRGYRAAVEHLADNLLAGGDGPAAPGPADLAAAALRATEGATWGLGAVLAATSRYQGRGVRLAVLDTGVDRHHPDLGPRVFAGRGFTDPSGRFDDGNGHGTHCAGTAAGPARPSGTDTRYGVAPGALLHVAKVLDDLGEGRDAHILAGIQWALTNQCRVISMSLGAPVGVNEAPSPSFEQIGRRARRLGAVLIAAAGNDSDRPNGVAPVSHPANCHSIMAVAAIDRRFAVARFSNAGLNRGGGAVDLAAPGVGVFSAWPGVRLYRQESGTSMATPHVAGLAALLLEARPDLSGDALFDALKRSARALPGLSDEDVGMGLAQAPP